MFVELAADKNIQRGNEFYNNEEEGDRNATLHREVTPPKRARSKSPRPQSDIQCVYDYHTFRTMHLVQHTLQEGLHCHQSQVPSLR